MARLEKENENPYYTIDHFAKNEGVTIQTVYRWIKSNDLETTRMNGLLFVRRKS